MNMDAVIDGEVVALNKKASLHSNFCKTIKRGNP